MTIKGFRVAMLRLLTLDMKMCLRVTCMCICVVVLCCNCSDVLEVACPNLYQSSFCLTDDRPADGFGCERKGGCEAAKTAEMASGIYQAEAGTSRTRNWVPRSLHLRMNKRVLANGHDRNA